MKDEILFGVKNPKLQAICCGCEGRGWLVTMLYGERSAQNKLILLCAGCERTWMGISDPDLNLLPDGEVFCDGASIYTEGVEGARR